MARQVRAEFPDAGHVALGVDVTEAADPQELTTAGLSLTQSAVLTAIEVHAPARPSVQAIYRRLSGDDDWQQATGLRTAIYEDGTGTGSAFLRGRITTQRAMTEAGHGSWFGAFIHGTLVAQLGIITSGTGPARYQDVETHSAARRQGLASTLLWHAAQHASPADRRRTMVILADPDDAAIRLYRSAGFTAAQTQTGFDRQQDKREAAS